MGKIDDFAKRGSSRMFGKKKPTVISPPKRSNKKVTPKKDLESFIQRECMDYLLALGLPCNRQNAGKVHVGGYHMKLAVKGSADLVSMMPDGSGRILEVECKRRQGGVQTKVQKERQALIEKWGGVYVLANTVDTLKSAIKEKSI